MRADSKKPLTRPIVYSALIIFMFLIPLFVSSPFQMHILIVSGIAIILSSSLRLIISSGLLSMAHGGMMAVGAYTTALLMMKLGFSSWVALGLGGLATAALAMLIGYPFVRIKGMYFGLTTAFLGESIRVILEEWRGVTGGVVGLMQIPGPDPISIPGLFTIDFSSRVDFYYLILVLVLVILFILYTIEHSRIGLTWSSIGQADYLAASVGINVARFQVICFAIGCFFSGIAGGFYSQYITTLNPSTFGFFWSVYIVIYMMVGGTGSFIGPIIGAFVMSYLPEQFRFLKEYQPYFFAGALMLIIIFLPDGLVSLPKKLLKALSKERHVENAGD